MKSVILVSQHFPPEMGAASNRMHHVAKHLAAMGIQVYVVTSQPGYPHPNFYMKDQAKKTHLAGVLIYRISVFRLPVPDKWLRLLNQLFFSLLAPWCCLYLRIFKGAEACITTSPPFFVNFAGLFMKVFSRMKWIMEVRDLWPDSWQAITGKDMNRSRIFRLLLRLEKRFYDKCDKIVAVTQGSREWMEKKGVPREKIVVIPNGIPDWAKSAAEPAGHQERRKTAFVVSYIGNLGLAQDFGLLMQLAKRTKGRGNIRFYFVGEGLAKPKLEEHCRENGLDHVHFVGGTADKRELVHWYRMTDLGIIMLKDAELFEHVIPSKLFEFGFFRVPVVLIGKGEPARIVRDYELGWVIGRDIDELELLVGRIQSGALKFEPDENKYEEFLTRFSWNRMIQQYASVLQ